MDAPTAGDVALVLARLEVKLDQALAQGGDHEARIRKLEDSRRWPAPAVAGCSSVLSSILTAVGMALTQ